MYEDRDFLVIDKPAGVASHGGSGVSFGAIELLRAARPRETLELAHRLDRDTSGVLVLAQEALGADRAAGADPRGSRSRSAISRCWRASCRKQRHDVDAPLRKSVLQGGERMVRVDDDGKPSRSRFSDVERFAAATLCRGRDRDRPHAPDPRACAAHRPSGRGRREVRRSRVQSQRCASTGLKRLFLHAARFEFSIGERSYGFSAPLPDDLKRVLMR